MEGRTAWCLSLAQRWLWGEDSSWTTHALPEPPWVHTRAALSLHKVSTGAGNAGDQLRVGPRLEPQGKAEEDGEGRSLRHHRLALQLPCLTVYKAQQCHGQPAPPRLSPEFISCSLIPPSSSQVTPAPEPLPSRLVSVGVKEAAFPEKESDEM